MERLKNLSAINTNTVEGRLLIAALSVISGYDPTLIKSKDVDETLDDIHDIAVKRFRDAEDIPPPDIEPETFDKSLEQLINKFSMENRSDTPDFILSQYLIGCLEIYNGTVKARDKWFGFAPFSQLE